MNKNSCFKILSLLLVFCLCVGSVTLGTLAQNGEDNSAENYTAEDIATLSFLPVTIKDFTGTVSGTSGGDITDFPRFYINTSNRDAARPRIALGKGVNGSNAMEIGALGASLTNYQLTFRFPNTNVLTKNTDYVVSVKVKKGEGEINGFKAGVNNNGITYGAEIGSEDISDGEWKELKWTYNTGTWTASKVWQAIIISMTAPESGATLLVDDITIYSADDETQENIMVKGSFDTNVNMTAVTEESGKDSGYIPVHVRDYTGTVSGTSGGDVSDFPRFYENTSNRDSARPRIAVGEGVNNSNALLIGALGERLSDYRLTFRFANTNVLTENTEYIVSVKIKKKEGEISKLTGGLQDTNITSPVMSLDLSSEYISSDRWTEFSWKHKTGSFGDANKVWSAVVFELVTSDGGASVLIDDICVYRADDQTKTNLMYKGSFDTVCKKFAVNENGADGKIVPMRVFDFAGHTKLNEDNETVWDKYSVSTSDLPRYYANSSDYHDSTAPKSSVGGFNGSYALQIGGVSGIIEDYNITVRFPTKGTWKNNTKYEVRVKLKKTQGILSTFTMGYEEIKSDTVVTLSDSDITENWAEYAWEFTSSDMASKDWNGITFGYTAPDGGATVLIDELRVYEVSAEGRTEIYQLGNFDYIDLGQENINYNYIPSGNTEPIMDPSVNKDYSGNGVAAKIMACESAPSGEYCLSLGFDSEKATNNTVSFTLHGTRSGGTYKIGFWAMVVGDVNLAQVGMTAGDYTFIPYGNGYSFNQYQNGKWAYYEFVAKDPGSFETNSSYRRFTVKFDAPARSGMLIDKVTVYNVNVDNSVNYMYMGDFEQLVNFPKYDWNSDQRFIYKEGQ